LRVGSPSCYICSGTIYITSDTDTNNDVGALCSEAMDEQISIFFGFGFEMLDLWFGLRRLDSLSIASIVYHWFNVDC
jgi:hypothetical protein